MQKPQPRQHTVLVVDDDHSGSRRMAELLGERGHHAVVAHSWTEAIRELAAHDVDMVLMDAVMPTVDGFKLTRLIRERPGSYLPIVFVAGRADAAARERAFEAGADDLLAKPVDPVELRLRIAAMLRIRDLTQNLEEKARALEELARRDGLTGLHNRRALDERLPHEIARAQRYGRELSVLMLDVDHFKEVNDGHGHDAGDRVLVCLGEVLRSSVRSCDGAFRYGGEELTVVAPETGPAGAFALAQRIRRAFEESSAGASSAGAQTLSVGVASLRQLDEQAGAADLLGAADAALYRAKHEGRDRTEVYVPAAPTSDDGDEGSTESTSA